MLRRPVRQLAPPGLLIPGVPLLDCETLVVEPEERGACQGLLRPVPGGDHGPPVHGRTRAVDEWLAKTALGRGLVIEGPRDVFGRLLPGAERMRVEDGSLGVERCDCIAIGARPRTRPDVRPPASRVTGLYFATSIARLSRITITFTWPGYSS